MEQSDGTRGAVATPRDDAGLVAALLARDEAAFTELVERWGPTMLRVARRHVSTDASAEEVVQDAWLAVLRGLDGFEGRASLRTWMFRVLVNIAKTRGVRERRTIPMSTLGDGGRADAQRSPTVDPDRFRDDPDDYPGHWTSFPAAWPTAEQEALGAQVRAVVDAAVAALPAQQRLVVTLRDLHGFPAEEVCELLDLSAGNQRVLLHRGRAVVRGRLEELYGQHARWGATP